MKNINKILPTEIISDILTRLPTEIVFDAKLVCKTWKDLIQLPTFPKMHSNHHLNHSDSADSGKLRYVISHPDVGNDYFKSVCYFELNENEDWNYAKPHLRQIRIETTFNGYSVIGSFNGLICIYYGHQSDLVEVNGPALIFNPVTRERIVLPECDNKYLQCNTEGSISSWYDHLACGFGYLAATNEYKVVRICGWTREPNVVEVEVYTVGSGKGWRHLGKFGLGFRFYTSSQHTPGVFLNGCLHWRNAIEDMVVVFDLAQEKFRDHIPPPPMLPDPDDSDDEGCSMVGVSGGGILYYAVWHSDERGGLGDVWLLMKKNDDNHGVGVKWLVLTKENLLPLREVAAFYVMIRATSRNFCHQLQPGKSL